MIIELRRRRAIRDATLGELYVDGAFECFTLEDEVHSGPKVAGATAIPAGEYPVQISYSRRFRHRLPLLVGVPEFQGVRIHAGNTAADTQGCILVGRSADGPALLYSRAALLALREKIEAAVASGGIVQIVITNEFAAGQRA